MRLAFRLAYFCTAVILGAAVSSAAQTSGSINGTVSDHTGAVLPGVAVTTTSPALMGAQTTVTNEQGQYRFPTLPPGSYTVKYELAGFSTVVRDGIIVQVGFTATVTVQLQLATLEETVTVTGASPVVDVQNTHIQNNFNNEMLKSIPSARDIWSLIGFTPGVTVERFDVGGSRAGTQTDYQAYGLSGQVRVMADGTNLTEGTGGEPYFDYGAFEEVQIGTDSNDASAATPGLQINTIIKSGGNDLKGELYMDYEHGNLQSRNVTDELRRVGVGEGSRITKYWDPNFNVGGPIKRDKLWYFVSYRNQRIGTTVTGFPADRPSDFEFMTRLSGITYKVSYAINPNNKLSQWIQFRRKEQPHRSANSNRTLDAVYKQDSISAYGGVNYDSIVSATFFVNARFGSWGYNWGNYAYGANGVLEEDLTHRQIERVTSFEDGSAFADRTWRRRWQGDVTGTLYKDAWAGANHAIKMGYVAEIERLKTIDDGYIDEMRLRYDSPAASPFSVPWRIQIYNTPGTARTSMWHHAAFLHDQISIGKKLTLNAGLRWDYYDVYHPAQEIQESRFRNFFYAGAPLPNGFSIPATYADFSVPGVDVVQYNAAWGPRVGVAYDLRGDGKNVLKASWGRYYHNPGPIATYNPIRNLDYTFTWNDLNRDLRFQPNEFGPFVSSAGSSSDRVAPNIGHPWTDDISLFFEREIMRNLGGRVGFVRKHSYNLYETIEQARVASLFMQARTFTDPGPDGSLGNGDDGPSFTAFDIPAGVTLPPSRGELQTPDENYNEYKSIEVSINKRMSNRWSLVTNFHNTWARTNINGLPEDPNEALYNEYSFTNWSFKVLGTYQGPWDVVMTPVVRHQSGDPTRRLVAVSLRSGTFNYTAEGFGKYRVDNPTIVDFRVEKRFRLLRDQRLGVFFDAFNITNSNAAEATDNVTGRRSTTIDGRPFEYAQFMRPTAILNPRVYRFGLKFDF